MAGTFEGQARVERMSPEDGGHYFFGYYDVQAWDGLGEYHLVHRVGFLDRRPGPEDAAEWGCLSPSGRAFEPAGRTEAWNFQQGAMLQWHPSHPGMVLYNRRHQGRYEGVAREWRTGSERILTRPIAAVSPDGRVALSINFSRLYDFRPGYGYAGIPDPWAERPQPEDDGIYVVDLESGASSLILSLAQIGALRPDQTAGDKLVVNHLTFNTDGSRFVFLARTFGLPASGKGWRTGLFTCDTRGKDLRLLQPFGHFSHYHWRDPEHLLIWGRVGGVEGLYLLKDGDGQAHRLDPAFFLRDGHCSFSPDRNWLLYDSYPIQDHRFLYLYDLRRGRGMTLGRFYGPTPPDRDIRCDLHPRWAPSGLAISFDSLHEGRRHLYRMDLSDVVGP